MSELTGLIFDIRKFSLHDGPGIRTTVFFKGCPLACWWCHNPESQAPAPELMLWDTRCIRCGACIPACQHGAIQALGDSPELGFVTDRQLCQACPDCMEACAADARELVGRQMTVDQVMAGIERDRAFYDESLGGVTFSGGEPLAQHAFLLELLRRCKALDLHTSVDTSGYTPWKALDSIRPFTDLFLYDLKVMDDARHRQYTGVPNGLILHNLQALIAHNARVMVRMPVIPGFNDDPQNLHHMGQFLRDLQHIERVDILPYHASATGKYARLEKPYHMPDIPSPSAERMSEIAAFLTDTYGLTVKIGG